MSKKTYKPKEENLEKLIIFLNKIKKDGKYRTK